MPGITVHFDETVLSRKGIIRKPISTRNYFRDEVWKLGENDTSE
jgi:hypothetical protein